jgi:16S rRNA (cytidine1402-2'-O)-methyltransferase
VSTPIGNLEDITLRALNVLKEVDFILCEDTRQTLKLLNHYEIRKHLVSSRSANERSVCEKTVRELQAGKSAALVSDNGTPNISDPGGITVEACRENGINVVPIPGASALTTLLSVCGFNVSPFVFLGFLSNKSGRRQTELSKYINFDGAIVIYESPHRIKKTLLDIYKVFGDKEIAIGRELTKKYEEIFSAKLSLIADNMVKIVEKGEYVIAVKNQK